MGVNSPVLAVVVFLWEIFLMVGEEGVELNALLEVLYCFCAPNLLKEIEVTIDVDASSDQSVPVNTLQLDVRIILLKLEVNSLKEVNVGSLNGVHVLFSRLKLVEIKVLGEHLHF